MQTSQNSNRNEGAEQEKPVPTIPEIRVAVDTIIKSIRHLNSSREVSLCYTALQLGFSYLGLALSAAGSPSPYKDSENHAVKTIEPQADSSDTNFYKDRWKDNEEFGTQTARVKDLRAELTNVIKLTEELFAINSRGNGLADSNIMLWHSQLQLKTAKIWLGWELGRIRDFKAPKPLNYETPAPTNIPL